MKTLSPADEATLWREILEAWRGATRLAEGSHYRAPLRGRHFFGLCSSVDAVAEDRPGAGRTMHARLVAHRPVQGPMGYWWDTDTEHGKAARIAVLEVLVAECEAEARQEVAP